MTTPGTASTRARSSRSGRMGSSSCRRTPERGRLGSAGCRGPDVLVQTEEVARVVVALDSRQPVVGQLGVGLVDARLALGFEEVAVDADRAGADGLVVGLRERLVD